MWDASSSALTHEYSRCHLPRTSRKGGMNCLIPHVVVAACTKLTSPHGKDLLQNEMSQLLCPSSDEY
jgi:hypothetical protein